MQRYCTLVPLQGYAKEMENRGWVISRQKNPHIDQIEFCVGMVHTDGIIDPISFGLTINQALANAMAMITDEGE